MKTKTILILAVIFAGLLVAYLVMEKPTSDIYKESAKSSGPVFPDFKPDKVRAIEITSKRYDVKLRKTDAGWIVDDADRFPADEGLIDGILQGVAAMNYSEIASENKENFSVFEVDGEKGVKVRLLDAKGQPLAAVITGKNGPGPEVGYVREDGSNTVTLQKGLQRYRFDQAPQVWKDRTILKFDPGKVEGIEINRVVMSEVKEGETAEVVGNERLVFVKSEGNWKMIEPENKPGKKTAIDNIVTILSNIRSTTIPDQAATDTGLDNPSIAVAVTVEGGSTYILQVGGENPGRPNEFFAKNSDKPYLYSISQFQVSKLMEPASELTQEPEAAAATETAPEAAPVSTPDGLQPPAPPAAQ